MSYLVKQLLPKGSEPSLEQLLFGEASGDVEHKERKYPSTVTRAVDNVSHLYTVEDIRRFVRQLTDFNRNHHSQFFADEEYKLKHYKTFKIPKASGGFREINAPTGAIDRAQRELAELLSSIAPAGYHASAFAYAQGRNIKQCISRHQANNSQRFLKLDFSDFFGNTNKAFVMHQLYKIVPFDMIIESSDGARELSKALDVCFLSDGLPQGTAISPMLTNLVMIPFDYLLNKELHRKGFVYTRYADDMLISHKNGFNPDFIINLVNATLAKCKAPYILKQKKTRYGSRSGRNFNLGLMLNKDNKITIGHKKHKLLKAKLNAFILDTKHDKLWSLEDIQRLQGELAYFKSIEPKTAEYTIKQLNKKYSVSAEKMLIHQLRSAQIGRNNESSTNVK